MGWLFQEVDSSLFDVGILDVLGTVRMVSLVGGRHLQIVYVDYAWVVDDKVVMVSDVRSWLRLQLVGLRLIAVVIITRGTHRFELSYLLLEVWIVFHHVAEVVVCDALLILPYKAAFLHQLIHGRRFGAYQLLQIERGLFHLVLVAVVLGATVRVSLEPLGWTIYGAKALPNLPWSRLL